MKSNKDSKTLLGMLMVVMVLFFAGKYYQYNYYKMVSSQEITDGLKSHKVCAMLLSRKVDALTYNSLGDYEVYYNDMDEKKGTAQDWSNNRIAYIASPKFLLLDIKVLNKSCDFRVSKDLFPPNNKEEGYLEILKIADVLSARK